MSFCADCFKGVRHEGIPEGKIEIVNGVKTYVATPEGDYPRDKAVIYLSDVYGALNLINHQLLADDFARNGFKVYAPDLFDEDPIAFDAPTDAGGIPLNLMTWLGNHPPAHAGEIARRLIIGLKEQGVTRFGTTGYCYGARPVFDFALENLVSVAVVSHPTFVEVVDLNNYAEKSKAPLLINSCEIDTLFTKEKQDRADALLGNGKFAPGYKRTYFEGCTHGFAVRGDLSDPKVKAGKEGAFKSAVEWFATHL
ncbi:alpha/beta-hydrolase [Auriscalpium vulgare]|uniref:Alpha/beta-hydrolase n=1 Tax=Auriscalpium vulgare TaxID=40419 RepID=A0ACB8RYH0_9AGAM|nr:alpha/beta-hydrolase [Auriscalpium vulgare]